MARHPARDGWLFIPALVHELLKAGKIDADYLARYTNAAWLVIDAPGSADDGLFARIDGAPLAFDRKRNAVVSSRSRSRAVADRRLHPRRRA